MKKISNKLHEEDKQYYSVECGFADGEPCEYVYYPDLTQVEYKNNEAMLEMTRMGFWAKQGEKIKLYQPSNTEGWTYYPGASVWGPSNEKAANKFFFSDRLTNEEWWAKIDELTGNSFEYFLSMKQNPAKILKNTSRLNLFGTTMELMDTIDLTKDYIVVANCSFNAVEDTDAETTERLRKGGMEFGSNINDGKCYLNSEIVGKALNISATEALDYSVQTRANYIQTKCLGETFLNDDMEVIAENVTALYGQENINIYGNTEGRCMMIVDDDGAKLVNKTALERGDVKINVYGLAIAKASNSRTSSQMVAKLLQKNPEATEARIEELVNKELNIQLIKDEAGKFNPTLGLMSNMAAVLKDKVLLDEAYCYNKLHELVNFTKSSIADMKIGLDSVYNHAMFDDSYVMSRGLCERILGIKDCGEYGQLIEVYSKDVNVYYAKEIEAIESNDELSINDKEAALDKILSAFIIKYPSAGEEEYLGVRYLTTNEWRQRGVKALKDMTDKGADERLIECFKNYMFNISFGVTVFANFNFIKNKLAGMDVDFDATLAVFDDLKSILLNKQSCNILTYIDYKDTNEADYSALITEVKRANLNFAK